MTEESCRDIMSVSEREKALLIHLKRRMAITMAAAGSGKHEVRIVIYLLHRKTIQ